MINDNIIHLVNNNFGMWLLFIIINSETPQCTKFNAARIVLERFLHLIYHRITGFQY